MPQEFQVVRCYACQVFQVQQVKKAPKWVCKMCGEKQSLKKEYGRGSGLDCRRHVQKLNMAAGELLDAVLPLPCSLVYNERALDQSTEENHLPKELKVKNKSSKWQVYIDDQNTDKEPLHELDTPPCFESAQVTLNRPQCQRRERREYDRWNIGRKRKRDAEDQDAGDESCTPSEMYMRNEFGSTLKTSKLPHQGKMFPSRHSVDCPANTAKQFSEYEQTVHIANGSATDGPSRQSLKSKRDGLKTPKPEVTHDLSSKWGQFLEDYQYEETDNHLRRIYSESGLEPEKSFQIQKRLPHEVKNSTSKHCKLDRETHVNSISSYADHENGFSKFSVGDESLIEEFLKDDW